MRELILKRIEEIKKAENGFPSEVQKWKNFSNGLVKKDASDIEWDKLSDYDLVFLFERLIRKRSSQT